MARWIEGEPKVTTRPPHTAHPRIEGTKVSPRVTGGERFKEFPVIDGELSLLIEPTATDFIAPSTPNLSLHLINISNSALHGNGSNKTQLTAPLAICDRESPSPNADSCREAYNLFLVWLRSLPRQKVTAGTKGRIQR